MLHKVNPDSLTGARLKDRMREVTRTAILDAAEQVYVQHGLSAGRMEQIAERAGVSVGTLYNYFSDRKALVGSLLDTRRTELLREVDEALAATADDPIQRLHALIHSALRHVEAHRAFVMLLVQEGGGDCVAMPRTSSAPAPMMLGLQTRVRDILERGFQGSRPRIDVALTTHAITGALRGAILYRLTEADPLDVVTTADRILEIVTRGAGLA